MFGHNKIMIPKSYENEPDGSLSITSIFYTLQGEGPFSGRPAVFVRLHGCNLKCSFCDTYFDSGDTLTYEQIFEKIGNSVRKFYDDNKIEMPVSIMAGMLLVITGGEPLNQKNLVGFLNAAHERNFHTQIESNGTIFQELPKTTYLVISPKINEATGNFIKVNEKLLHRADCLKFVVSKTMPGYTDIPDFAIEWFNRQSHKGKLYVSPMNCYNHLPVKIGADGTLEKRSEVDERISFWTPGLLDLKKNQENHEHAAFIAMKHGCRLSIQTHLFASLP